MGILSLGFFFAGAHHVDLRFATKEDPVWLQNVRIREVQIIREWLKQYYKDIAKPSL